jgi:alkylation response protein AidB-like acyl-CoA dehydrogenase
MTTTTTARGGAWLIEDAPADSIFTPEKLSDEHRLISQTADEFMTNEVLPAIERLEQKDWALARDLVRRAGELGLLGTDVPEALGGVGLDKVSSVLVGEAVGRAASFATTFGAQTGLAITPLVCFGTDAQKAQYLPGLVSGELVGAYALSESGSGSDALGAKARATRQPDGSFTLNGEKMWITNGGFADLFIVFAKVTGDAGDGAFTAFLVERAFPGVSSGKEEHKMASWIVNDAADTPGSEGARGERPGRDREGPQGRVQRAQLRPFQACRHVQRRGTGHRRRRSDVRRPAKTVRPADRVVWRD